jgi:hypothetical protein
MRGPHINYFIFLYQIKGDWNESHMTKARSWTKAFATPIGSQTFTSDMQNLCSNLMICLIWVIGVSPTFPLPMGAISLISDEIKLTIRTLLLIYGIPSLRQRKNRINKQFRGAGIFPLWHLPLSLFHEILTYFLPVQHKLGVLPKPQLS